MCCVLEKYQLDFLLLLIGAGFAGPGKEQLVQAVNIDFSKDRQNPLVSLRFNMCLQALSRTHLWYRTFLFYPNAKDDIEIQFVDDEGYRFPSRRSDIWSSELATHWTEVEHKTLPEVL